MAFEKTLCIFITLLMSFLVIFSVHGELSPGFYTATCADAEKIVSQAVKAAFLTNPTIAPGLLRMQFHDCFVRGCDGSVLLSGNNSERTAIPNLSLRGFEVIEDAKTQLERLCPGVVSCADILALAARDSVVMMGGPTWAVPLGRLDGRVSAALDVQLPAPSDEVATQRKMFAANNLTSLDLVVLLGAHTIGTAGCSLFRDRFFNFNNTGSPDPTIDPTFIPNIQSQCPLNGSASTRVPLDTGSATKFDSSYFTNLRLGHGVLRSDQVLWTDPDTKVILERLLGIQSSFLDFQKEFVTSMIKMTSIEVKTGTEGEIRTVCSKVN